MKNGAHIWLLDAKNFFRGKTVLIGAGSLVLFGFYSFFYGASIISQQQHTIDSVPVVQQNHLHQIAAHGAGKSAGTTAYYPFFYTSHPASPWAGFSIGQRDVNPFTLKVKMLAIEGQLHDSELTNPLTLLTGNLDAAFVFLFLFPLLIIAFTYNVFSEEQESGVWQIVRTTASDLRKTMAVKLGIRLAAVLGVAVIVFAFAVIGLGLPFSFQTFQLFFIVLGYLAFWFALSVLVVSLGKSSAFNATTLVSVWIFLCILFPGVANVAVNSLVPVPEAAETAIRQREGYHAKWDQPKGPTMEKFYAVYPQFRKYPIPQDRYSPGWYYAMQFSGDLESASSSEKLFTKLAERQSFSEQIGLFNPVVAAQQLFNQVANTDLASHVRYLRSVKDHHREVREYFYPFIFENTPTENVNWAGYPPFKPAGYYSGSIAGGLFALAVWAAVLLGLSMLFFQKNFTKPTQNQHA